MWKSIFIFMVLMLSLTAVTAAVEIVPKDSAKPQQPDQVGQVEQKEQAVPTEQIEQPEKTEKQEYQEFIDENNNGMDDRLENSQKKTTKVEPKREPDKPIEKRESTPSKYEPQTIKVKPPQPDSQKTGEKKGKPK